MDMKKYIVGSLLMIFSLLGSIDLLAENGSSQSSSSSMIDSLAVYDWILIAFASILLLIIFVLANTLHLAMSKPQENGASNRGGKLKVPTIFLVILLVGIATGDVHAAGGGLNPFLSPVRMFVYLVIIIEFIAIGVLINWIKYFTGIQAYKEEQELKQEKEPWSISKLWIKMNRLKSVEEEESLDIGHSYDGIRELDNATPPWFTVSFIATIIFAFVYMYRYHIAYSAPNQLQEYKMEVAQANADQKAYLASQGNLVDETSVTMLDAAGISAGKGLYTSNCVACHGAAGEGGVGPNLTDDYWLHGGSINDIFKVIKYGVVEKGMKAWQEDFSANQIAQLSSFIKSIHGTNPPGGKEKQGDLFSDKAGSPADAVQGDSTSQN
jgi:cytochrome c oxidase cbb3-type subunit 3